MTKHIIGYPGVHVSLAVMQEAYISLYLPWVNRRIDIEGTLQRPPYTLEDGTEWIKKLRTTKGHDEVFAVLVHHGTASKRTYQYIGHMGIHKIRWPDGVGISGSILGYARGQGRGHGTEAKLLLLHHSFHVLGLRKICSDVKDWNAQSLGHLLKCGYQIVGRQKRQVWDTKTSTHVDNILLEVFREEWEPIWEKYQKTKQLPKLTPAQKKLVENETKK